MLLVLALVAAPTPVAHAATITVNSTAGTKINGDGACTLREAIENANSNTATWPECEAGSGADTIELPAGATITLTVGDNGSGPDINGLPAITSNITINGKNAIIQRSPLVGIPNFRIFYVSSSGTLTLNNATVRYGKSSVGPGGESGYGGGFEVTNSGTLVLNNCTVSGNSTGNVIGSSNSGFGGGINGEAGATVTVTNSTISGNSTGSVVLGTAGNGGGIAVTSGHLTVTNTTISGNTGGQFGGGIYIYPQSDSVTSSTITGNTAATGGGVFADNYPPWATVSNTIVAMNTASVAGPNCGGLVLDGGNNIDSGPSCGWDGTYGSMSGVDPLLGPLAGNGGPTRTHALLPGSPAIDGVTYNAPNGSPSTDQRGFPRLQGTLHDIGAFELVQQLFLPLILRNH
jgi:CSLREA domain-containing protein